MKEELVKRLEEYIDNVERTHFMVDKRFKDLTDMAKKIRFDLKYGYLSTSHNTDYDSEKDKPSLHPKGEICPRCQGRGKYRDDFECQKCGGTGKLSHNQ